MKKLLICLSALFLMAGCDNGTKTLSCTSTDTANGLTTDTKYDVKYDGDVVKSVTITYHYTQDNTNTANNTTNNGVTNGNTNGTVNGNAANNGTNARTGTNNTTNNNANGTNNATNNNTNGTNNITNNDDIDGIDADTDGIDEDRDNDSNNNRADADDIVDGIVGDAIDTTINGVTDTILDIAGIRTTYQNQFTVYDNIEGFTYKVDTDSDNEYKVVYEIDMDKINDSDLTRFNVDRSLSTFRSNYEDLGYTCK